MKSATTIRRHLKELRELIDNSDDPAEQRIAYAMETAIRWATRETVGWGRMVDDAKQLAVFLRQELRLPHQTSGNDSG